MGKIFRTNLQLVIFIVMLLVAISSAMLAHANKSVDDDWADIDYSDYVKDPDFYTVKSVPIKEFKTLNGSDYEALTILDFYRVCIVEVTFDGGQTMKFYVPRDYKDKIGDNIEIAYEKHWDTEYEKVMAGSDITENSILTAARTTKVYDGLYARIFTGIAIFSGLIASGLLFISYNKNKSF